MFSRIITLLSRRAGPVSHPPLRGVNLGGWLVLEKWITPGLFAGTQAEDEYSLCEQGDQTVQARLRAHRDTFITKDDFVWLAAHGIQAVRLPVGYWTFGGQRPYQATIEYVDRVFAWAQETGLYVLVDLHAAPGSQNGWDHSGRAGTVGWADQEENIIATLEVLGKLAERYATHPRLLGFELLNEPKWTLPKSTLERYYQAAYKLVRDRCGPNVWVVISDNFRPRRWRRALRGEDYHKVLVDTHQYQTFSAADKRMDVAGHMVKTARDIPRLLAAMRTWHPIVVGEWSLVLDQRSLKDVAPQDLPHVYQAYAAAQLLAYGQSSAWFYWTYKTESGGLWSYRDCVRQGLLPDFAENHH